MDAKRYLELQKKENKTDVEWELLKAVSTIRIVSELVTDADKHDKEPQHFIDRIRDCLNNND